MSDERGELLDEMIREMQDMRRRLAHLEAG